MTPWTPSSWRTRAARQLPAYGDAAALDEVTARLTNGAPVVAIAEAAALRVAMTGLATRGGFLLQGGDCAESFDDAVAMRVSALVDLFGAMAARIAPALSGAPLVEVARIAGQFAKPRTSEREQQGGETLPAYRGDIINRADFTPEGRAADPKRMLRAHLQSVGAAASLGAARGPGRPPIFASHEALLLPYEQPLVRRDGAGQAWSTSGHMLWIGDRTRDLDGAHVEFARGINNVIGIKCGPDLGADELLRLAARIDPGNQPGKLVLIGRFGAGRVNGLLPPLLRATRREGLGAVWAIDPMHGNTSLSGARKIRRMADILTEIDAFFALARAEDVHPGGVHLEMSALDVTECLGGRGPASIGELEANWQSACDPRLNRAQAIDLAEHVAALLAPARALSA